MNRETKNASDSEAFQHAMNTAVRILSIRNHTRKELEQKLKKRHYGRTIIQRVLSECERLKYIDDETTAELVTRQLSEKGYGTRRIKMALQKKGVSPNLIQEVLSSDDEEQKELNAARKAAEGKWKRLQNESDEKKRKEKMIRFLYSRGFTSSIIFRILQEENSEFQ